MNSRGPRQNRARKIGLQVDGDNDRVMRDGEARNGVEV